MALSELRGRPLLSYAVRAALAVTDQVVVVTDSYVEGVAALLREEGPVELRQLDSPSSSAQLRLDAARASRVIVHDPRCPLLAATELRRVAASPAPAAVGVRPVTDTVKTVGAAGPRAHVSATVNRDDYRAVCSPLALSAAGVAILDEQVGTGWWTMDVWRLAAALRPVVGVDLVDVSSLGRRVEDDDAIWLLECVDDVRRMVRET